MSTQDQLRARMRAARETWIDLEAPPAVLSEGMAAPARKRVRVIRPTEAQQVEIAARRYSDVLVAQTYVTGWEGFTEADFLGAALGASDPLEFDAATWAEAVADRLDWIRTVTDAVAAAMNKHRETREVQAGN